MTSNDLIEKRGKNSSFANLPTIPDADGGSDYESGDDNINDD